ncbi:MAG: hypothetical protein CMJ32_04915 [Phycisphaerae bacterium]|nr:hypothetical protein [Phycisphaerae bacterium]
MMAMQQESRTTPATVPIALWLDQTQEPLLDRLLAHHRLHPIMLGSPDTSWSRLTADRLGLQYLERPSLCWSEEAGCPLLIGSNKRLDTEELHRVLASGSRKFSLVPRPGTIEEINHDSGLSCTLIPLFRNSPTHGRLMDVMDSFGRPRAINICIRCRPEHGHLGGRLFDAMDLVLDLCDAPQRIDATYVPTTGCPGPEQLESLRDLHGHLSMNLRLGPDRCASIMVSNDAGQWLRGITLLGDSGCLRVSDTSLSWYASDGGIIESIENDDEIDGTEFIIDGLVRNLDGKAQAKSPDRHRQVLALCESVRLSCRTGTAEEPSRMFELLDRV